MFAMLPHVSDKLIARDCDIARRRGACERQALVDCLSPTRMVCFSCFSDESHSSPCPRQVTCSGMLMVGGAVTDDVVPCIRGVPMPRNGGASVVHPLSQPWRSRLGEW
jgi:hypothetical protein